MTTLYIDRRHSSLAIEAKALVVRFNGERQRPIPLLLLERVVLLVNVALESNVLLTLAEAGVAVQLAGARQPQRRALVLGKGHNNVRLRLAQYGRALDKVWCRQFAAQLVGAKLQAQHRLLGRILRDRPDKRKAIHDTQQQIAAAQLIAETLAQSSMAATETENPLATLLGLEGSAARAYFSAYAAVLPVTAGFSGRRRRPPPDPVNASLSLAYTLLHGRAVQMIHTHGLEPLLGFYHQPAYGRESLASDLIEPWRPHIDEWVWDQFRRQSLTAAHFKFRDGGCFLDKKGRAVFFAGLEPVLQAISRGMRWRVRNLIQDITGEAEQEETMMEDDEA